MRTSLQFDCQFGKTMENKTPKIHQLKGKSRGNQSTAQLTHKNSKQLLQVSPNLPQMNYLTAKPILIRYIDPRLVPIFKEFNTLTTKCQEIVQKARDSQQLAQKEKIQELLQSTKKINDQFHELIDQSQQIATEPFKVENSHVILSETGGEEQKNVSEKEDNQRQEQAISINPIETVNRASERIDQLELENIHLKSELQKQKKRTSEVEHENKELKYKLSKLQKEKKEMLVNIRHELERLKDDDGLRNISKMTQLPTE